MLTPLAPADAETILPIATVKERIRKLDDFLDSDVEGMRLQSIALIENYTSKALDRRQLQWIEGGFRRSIRLPMGPVASVDAISYYDSDGVDTALVADDWHLGGGFLQAAHGTSWPSTADMAAAVRITFTAGYDDLETEAPDLMLAVLAAIAALREDPANPDFSAALSIADGKRTLRI